MNTVHSANSCQEFISREGEIGEKIRACHSFQNASISQRRTSQMIRRSPTAYESRIYVLTITLRKIFLVFQLGECNLSCNETQVKKSEAFKGPSSWGQLSGRKLIEPPAAECRVPTSVAKSTELCTQLNISRA